MPRGIPNKKKAAKAPARAVRTNAVSVPTHYNQQGMIDSWKQGSSIREIAQAQGCSEVYARRVLSTKAPDVYKAGLQSRHAGTQAVVATGNVRAMAASAGGNGVQISSESVGVIARAVAHAMLSDATLTPKATTREEMFDNITKGVEDGVKKMGFHS